MPGVPWPLASVALNRFSPRWIRPCGLTKRASSICPDLLGLGVALQEHADGAVRGDGDLDGVLVDLNAGGHAAALVGAGEDQFAVGVHGERPVAGVEGFVFVLHHEEPVPADRHVQLAGGFEHVALGEGALGAGDPGAQADLHAQRNRVPLPVRGAGEPHLLVEQVFEVHPLPLEAGGPGVGEVVGDHVEFKLERMHAGAGTLEGAEGHTRSGVGWRRSGATKRAVGVSPPCDRSSRHECGSTASPRRAADPACRPGA